MGRGGLIPAQGREEEKKHNSDFEIQNELPACKQKYGDSNSAPPLQRYSPES